MIFKNKKESKKFQTDKYKFASDEKMSMESSLSIVKNFSEKAGNCNVAISFKTKTGFFETIYYDAKENKLSDALPEQGQLILIPVEKHESVVKVIYED